MTQTKAIDADVTAALDRWAAAIGTPDHRAASEALDALLVDLRSTRRRPPSDDLARCEHSYLNRIYRDEGELTPYFDCSHCGQNFLLGDSTLHTTPTQQGAPDDPEWIASHIIVALSDMLIPETRIGAAKQRIVGALQAMPAPPSSGERREEASRCSCEYAFGQPAIIRCNPACPIHGERRDAELVLCGRCGMKRLPQECDTALVRGVVRAVCKSCPLPASQSDQ